MTMPTTSAEDAAAFSQTYPPHRPPIRSVTPAWRTCMTFREPPLWAEIVFHGGGRVELRTGLLAAGAGRPQTFEAQWYGLDDVAGALNAWVQQQTREGCE